MSTSITAVRPARDHRPDWRTAAACRDANPELFFPDGDIRSARAKGAFQLTKANWRAALRGGARTMDQHLGLLGMPSGGALRASVGLASNVDDGVLPPHRRQWPKRRHQPLREGAASPAASRPPVAATKAEGASQCPQIT